MVDYSDGVMIALLPVQDYWCRVPIPHMTLVYAGTTDELSPMLYNELGKDVLEIARRFTRQTLDVTSIETFGSDKKVDALKLKGTEDIFAMRQLVERWNASEHPFNPHATIGPAGSTSGLIPLRLDFDRVSLHWGERIFSVLLTVDAAMTRPGGHATSNVS